MAMHSVWCTAEKAHPDVWKGINTHIHVHVQIVRATRAGLASDYIIFPHGMGVSSQLASSFYLPCVRTHENGFLSSFFLSVHDQIRDMPALSLTPLSSRS